MVIDVAAMEEILLAEAAHRAGIGIPRIIGGADPAAGAEPSLTIPGGDLIRLVAFTVTVVYSAIGAARAPRLRISDGTTIIEEVIMGAVIPVNSTRRLYWAAGLGNGVSAGFTQVEAWPAPDLELFPGYVLNVLTTNLDAADDYAAPRVYGLAFPLGRIPPSWRL